MPEPSIRLVIVLALFAAVVVMSFAMLDGSGRHSFRHNDTAVSHSRTDGINAPGRGIR
jgi:hypothetical protein